MTFGKENVSNNSIALDIGGNGVQYVIFQENQILEKGNFNVVGKDKFFVINTIANLLNKYKITKVAISSPCAVESSSGFISGISGIQGYGNFNLYEEIKSKVNHKINIIALNDANAALFSNVRSDIKNAIQISIGTGIGGAIFIDGKIVEGKNGFAGEFGYSPIMNIKKSEYINMSLWCSTNAMVKLVNEQSEIKFKNAKDILDMSQNSNINSSINKWIDRISLLILDKYFSFSPDVIFLSGGITNNKNIIFRIKKRISKILDNVGYSDFIVNIEIPNSKNQSLDGAIKLLKTMI